MIARYIAKHAVAQQENFKGKGLWKLRIDTMRKKIINKTNLLRRIGCHSAALSPDVAITVAKAMTDSNFTNHSQIWQMGNEASEIQTELNAIYRTILGVKTQLLRDNIASLKIRNSYFSTPESRLIHRVYKALLGDPKRDYAY